MRQISLVFGLGMALVVLTGCPKTPGPTKCDNDEGCKAEKGVCVQGQCVECRTDDNCQPGFQCQNNKCVPKGAECGANKACAEGMNCEAGKCVAAAPAGCKNAGDCAPGENCEAGTCVAAAATCNYSPIRFGFNESTLTSDVQQSLRDLAGCLKQGKEKLTLKGYADERGTEEYNLHLSERRAGSVKKYLSTLGVSGNRLATVGYGENNPVNSGHDEAAWAENRRVEFSPK